MSPRTTTTTGTVDPGRRPDIESDLTEKYHVGWEFLTGIETSQFDIEESLSNQARFEALDEDTVEQYREAVERHDPFPGVIAYRRRANGKLIIVDGNHRLVAHDRAGMPIDVYEIEKGTRPQTISLMTFAFNTRHGRPTTEEERVTQALFLIDNGASMTAAAAAVNVPERIMKRAMARAQADRRASEVGADMREWDALTQAGKSRLLNISTDEGFKDAIHLAYAAKLDSTEMFDLVALLNSSKSATRQRAIIKNEMAQHSDRIQDGGGGVLTTADRRAMTPKRRIRLAMGQVLALPDDIAAITRAFAREERTDMASQLLSASERLRKIANALDSKVT